MRDEDKIAILIVTYKTTKDVGCPTLGFGGWGLGLTSAITAPGRYESAQPSLPGMRPTAPRPVLRMLHQLTDHRIRVHVIQFLAFLSGTINIEVIKSRLPECRRFFAAKFKSQLVRQHLLPSPKQSPRNPLFQFLDRLGRSLSGWFTYHGFQGLYLQTLSCH